MPKKEPEFYKNNNRKPKPKTVKRILRSFISKITHICLSTLFIHVEREIEREREREVDTSCIYTTNKT